MPLRFAVALVLLCGCDATLTPRVDAGTDELDAGVGIDAPSFVDAPPGPMDAPPGTIDAPPGMDASWGPCGTGAMMGTCLPTALCTGTRMAGLCPGPADIQCCFPGSDAGPRPDSPGTITPADVLSRLGACTRIGGDYANDVGGTANIPVCQTDDVVWWQADFDVDCDGGSGAICMSDPYYLPETSGVDSMGNPLDASTLPFLVIPLASTRFRYADHGIAIGQVGLAIYEDRMVWGIFGDAGPASIIGEGSFAMAEALGIPSSPISGGVGSGVTFLFFTGSGNRVSRNEDHAECVSRGEVLLESFVGP